MENLLWEAYDILLDISYGNPHRRKAVKIANKIIELLEQCHPTSKLTGLRGTGAVRRESKRI